MTEEAKRTKWTVILKISRSHLIASSGKLAWVYERERAEKIAANIGGIVVDAEEFVKNPQKFYAE